MPAAPPVLKTIRYVVHWPDGAEARATLTSEYRGQTVPVNYEGNTDRLGLQVPLWPEASALFLYAMLHAQARDTGGTLDWTSEAR